MRDQERSPIAADLKRAMREKATMGVRTFALTADVKEAHKQVPIHPRDWHLLGCRVEAGADVRLHQYGRNFWCSVSLLLLVTRVFGSRQTVSIPHRRQRPHVAHGGSRRQPPRSRRRTLSLRAVRFLSPLQHVWGATFLEQDGRWRDNSLGGIRTAAQHSPPGHLTAPSGVVRSGPRGDSGVSCLSWVRSSSKGLSSDPCIDSCRSTPDPQYAESRPMSDSFSDILLIGYRALGITTVQSRWKAQRWHHEWTRRQAARGQESEAGSRTEDRTARSMLEGPVGFRWN